MGMHPGMGNYMLDQPRTAICSRNQGAKKEVADLYQNKYNLYSYSSV